MTVYEYRCPEHPDSVQHFLDRLPAVVVVCRWVTRAEAGYVEQCMRTLTPRVLPPAKWTAPADGWYRVST